jgi:glucose-6-phosphate-specific signal transduction histidine kinase
MSEIVFYPETEARFARQKEIEQLGEEITELAAHIHAATYKLLDRILHQYDALSLSL